MATTRYEKKRRRRYILLFKFSLVSIEHEQALDTYAKRMQAIGLYSNKTGMKDIKSHIMQTAAKLCGYRWYGDWLDSNKLKRWW